MKNILFSTCTIIAILLASSCSTTKSKTFDEDTVSHERIAVLPFKTRLKLREKQKESYTESDIKRIELEQGKEVQSAVESYLVGRNISVRIQSASMTNSKLRDAGIDFYTINDHDITKLANILGVDAVVAGYLETEQPMSEELAMGLNVAKSVESQLLGTSFGSAVKTSTNRGMCRVSVFEGVHGDRLWSYTEDMDMGVGSTTQDIINTLMRKGARKFPY